MSDDSKPAVSPQGRGMSTTNRSKLGRGFQKAKEAVTGPMELPRLFHQLVIFLLDGSASMTWQGKSGRTKGEELHDSISKVVQRLKESKNSNCFDISCRVYSTEETCILDQVQVRDIDLESYSFNPVDHIEPEGTYLADSIQAAAEEARQYLKRNSSKKSQVLIILLSDGALHDEEDALEQASQLRAMEGVTLASIFFETVLSPAVKAKLIGDPNHVCAEVMEAMATEKANFLSTVDPEAVRRHMIRSISKVSKF